MSASVDIYVSPWLNSFANFVRKRETECENQFIALSDLADLVGLQTPALYYYIHRRHIRTHTHTHPHTYPG